VTPHPFQVATCIACGARSRFGECPGGCEDVPIDLVDAAALAPLETSLERLGDRLAALRRLAASLVEDDEAAWPDLRREASDALHLEPALPAPAEIDVVEAWGCLTCGRVDAPQPCLGVCVRRPVAMVEARCLHDLTAEIAVARADDARLSALARLVAGVTPRTGQLERTRAALRARARIALEAVVVDY